MASIVKCEILKEGHTHQGIPIPAGAVVDLRDDQAAWLIHEGVAAPADATKKTRPAAAKGGEASTTEDKTP